MGVRQWTCMRRHGFGFRFAKCETETSLEYLQRQSALLQITGIDYLSQYHRVFALKCLIQYNVLRCTVTFMCLICEKLRVGFSMLLSNWAKNPVRVSFLGWLTPHRGQLVVAVLLVLRASLCLHLICHSLINYDLFSNYF